MCVFNIKWYCHKSKFGQLCRTDMTISSAALNQGPIKDLGLFFTFRARTWTIQYAY